MPRVSKSRLLRFKKTSRRYCNGKGVSAKGKRMTGSGKRTMSPAAKAKISAAAKARWAKVKAAKGK